MSERPLGQPPSAEAVKNSPRCPYCAELIQPGARKCPHCRELLDPELRAREERRFSDGVARSLAADELREKILHSVIASAVGIIVFCMAGLLFGPMALGFAVYYRRRARALEMAPPSSLTVLYILSGVWTLVGLAFVGIVAFMAK